MKIYISGPMTGYPDFNRPAFMAADEIIRHSGHEPVNPAKVVLPDGTNPTWTNYMRADIKTLMDCDEVWTLPGWSKSRGAKIEVGLAKKLGIPVRAT